MSAKHRKKIPPGTKWQPSPKILLVEVKNWGFSRSEDNQDSLWKQDGEHEHIFELWLKRLCMIKILPNKWYKKLVKQVVKIYLIQRGGIRYFILEYRVRIVESAPIRIGAFVRIVVSWIYEYTFWTRERDKVRTQGDNHFDNSPFSVDSLGFGGIVVRVTEPAVSGFRARIASPL